MAESDPDTDSGEARPSRRAFGVTVVTGLAGAALAAVAGNQAWVSINGDSTTTGSDAFDSALSVTTDASAPPVTATALVVLAAWGVVLVSRGRSRLVVAWLGLLASVAVLGFALLVWVVAPDAVARDLPTLDIETTHTAWSYLGVLGGFLTLAAAIAAVRRVRGWPEMGRRYDAPGAAPDETDVPPEEQSSIDLWKALDEGRDPTRNPAPPDTPTGPLDSDR